MVTPPISERPRRSRELVMALLLVAGLGGSLISLQCLFISPVLRLHRWALRSMTEAMSKPGVKFTETRSVSVFPGVTVNVSKTTDKPPPEFPALLAAAQMWGDRVARHTRLIQRAG